MDLATALWIAVPLALVHIVARRSRALLLFQVAVDVMLLLLPGRLLLRGLHVGPGAPGGAEWGGPVTASGSPEQSDLPLEFAPWWSEVRRLIAAGEPPWISDRIGGGAPLFANGQSELPFPLQLPVWALGPERGSDVMAFWKLELAALGGFLLLRRLGTRPLAAASGALAYGFGLYQLSWLVVPLAWVVAAAPWAWWSLIGALRGDRRQAAGLAVLLGGLAGWSVHPETAAFLWLALALAGTPLAWGRWRRLRRLAVPFLLALPIAAVGAVPVAATIAGTAKYAASRARPSYPDLGLSWSLKERMAALILAPWREGHPGTFTWRQPFPNAAVVVGVGAVPVALLLLGGVRRRHRRVAAGFAAVGLGAAALVYQLPVISWIAGRLPVLGVMTWVRAGFLIGFAITALGALAFDAWLRRPARGRLALAALAVAAAATGLAVSGPVAPGPESVLALTAPVAVAVTAAAGVGGLAVPVAIAVEAISHDWNVLGGAREPAAPPVIVQRLQRLAASGGGRVLGVGAALPPNLAARLGLADLRSADPMRPLGLARLHQALGAAGMDLPGPVTTPWAGLAGAWGVRWLATPPAGVTGPAATGWQEVYRDGGGRVYRNSRALPVLRLAGRVVRPPGDAGAGAWEGVDFAATAVTAAPVAVAGGGSLQVRDDRPWRHEAEAEVHGAALAVLHVPYAPGWACYLDDRRVATVDADLGAMAIVVPAGEHDLLWVYEPPGFVPGVLLTIAGLLGAVAIAVRSPRRRR